MPSPESTALPPPRVCEQARLSRDPRFDGLFFIAVTSTRIYCRPVCPVHPPKPSNITYYRTAAAAEASGFRPCLRCRPELSPSDGAWRRGDAAVSRALKLIEQGALAGQSVAALAERVNLGERQLRRLFVERLGASPVGVHGTRRLLFAKQLLTETPLPITDVALAAGFGSLRRFNATFKEAYRMAPRDLRRRPTAARDAQRGGALTLRLGYRPPYDFESMLGFLRGRALPGVEHVDDRSYTRVVAGDRPDAPPGWLRVSPWPGGEHALQLQLHAPLASRLFDIVGRLRRMFDLDADPRAIASALSADPRLKPLLRKRPGLRLPSGWDGFEIAVRAILGQQVSVAAARTFAARIAERFGTPLPAEHAAHGLTHLFPAPGALADADFAGIGITRTRAETVRTIARALLDGRVDFRVERTLDDFVASWTALPGVGPWTANYIALRALGHPDAFPADDLVLQKAVPLDGTRMTAKALTTRAEAWRPWRGYATLQLWRASMPVPAAGAASSKPAAKRDVIPPPATDRAPERRERTARRTDTPRTTP